MSSTKIFSLFLLCAFTFYPSSTTSELVDLVFDVDDVPIENGGTSSYYMVPYISAVGGGVGLDTTGYESCPTTVVQQRSEMRKGLPVKISAMTRSHFVPEGRVKITFAPGPECGPTPPVWTIEHGPKGSFVKVTESKFADKYGYFVIEKSSTGEEDRYPYKLSFCSESDHCGTIGIVNGGRGKRVLGITERPFEFMLVRVETTSST